MIHEFALEPAMVARWSGREAIHVTSNMGIGTPRLLCGAPSIAAWKKEVLQLAEKMHEGVALTRVVEVVRLLTEGATRRTAGDAGRPWAEFVQQEHRRIPFAGIIATTASHPPLAAEDVIWTNQKPWERETTQVIRRQAADLASVCSPFLRLARHIVIVDPYFSPQAPGFVDSLQALLVASFEMRPREVDTVRVVLLTHQDINASAFSGLARRIPQKVKLEVIHYDEREDSPHNRYVLTDLGGIMIQAGTRSSAPTHTDDVSVMAKSTYQTRWRQYALRSEGFAFKHVTTLTGTGPLRVDR